MNNYYNYGYGYGGTDTFFTGALLIIFLVLILLELAIGIFYIICLWKIFKKANKPGWAAIIPVYNNIIMLEIAKLPWWNIFVMLGAALIYVISMLFEDSLLFLVPAMISIIITCAYQIAIMIRVSNNFGKDKGFKILAIFLPIVALPMLAFGKSTYIDKNEEKNFCPECGTKLLNNSIYCQNCGSKVN